MRLLYSIALAHVAVLKISSCSVDWTHSKGVSPDIGHVFVKHNSCQYTQCFSAQACGPPQATLVPGAQRSKEYY